LTEVIRIEMEPAAGDGPGGSANGPIASAPAFARTRPATLRGPGGAVVPIECQSAPIRNDAGVVVGRVLVFRDISERRRAEDELRRSREELRLLAAHVERVREAERKHIAREVHDELGQKITGLRMDLSWMEKRLPAIPDAALREPLAAKARSMFELLDQMVKTVRKISAELRPGVLDDLGLVAALEWQARDWQARTGIECHVTASLGEVPACPERDTALFRIFQEALTNVARHARATQVTAHLGAENGWLALEIRDNGRGITLKERQRAKSFGLLGMNERAMLLGGRFEIRGEPGPGTTVRVQLPLAGATSA
jgi:signal transduction histidine kinase